MTRCMFDYTVFGASSAFGSFESPNAIENLVRLETTYLVNSPALFEGCFPESYRAAISR